jgi:hypothetical protein
LPTLERGQAVVRIGIDDANLAEISVPETSRGNVVANKKQSRTHHGEPRERVKRMRIV